MKLSEFLLNLSTDPLAMTSFMCNSGRALNQAGLSEAEKSAVMEGDLTKLRALLQLASRLDSADIHGSTPPGPSPTPPPELEIESMNR
jgi:hypothetical protein